MTTQIRRINKFLLDIAKQGEVYQTDLVEITKLSYRQILRQLELLNNADLIHLKRTEPSSKRGKEKNVWEITFKGLIQALAMIRFEISPRITPSIDFDIIAENNRDKWIIFKEWKLLMVDNEVKYHVLFGIAYFASKKVQRFVDYSDLKIAGNVQKSNEKDCPDFLNMCESDLVRDATLSALRLDDTIFEGMTPNLTKNLSNNPWARLWKTAMKSEELRFFIQQQFTREEKRHQRVQILKDWLFSTENWVN